MTHKTLRPFWRTPVKAEVENELAFHLEMTTRELMRRGMTEQQARAEAERRFGNAAAVDAECRRFAHERDRNERKAEYRHEVTQDIAFAIRQLLKTPAFSVVAILTLALGIGATAAVFSVLNAVVLRPLPFDHAERMVAVYPTHDGEAHASTAPEFLAMRDAHIFEHVSAEISDAGVTIKLGDVPEMVQASRVSYDDFAVFGSKPELGRTFTAAEDTPGHDNVVVLSHGFWVSHFNGDRSVLGRAISIDGVPHTVIGIMPAAYDLFSADDNASVFVPLALTADQATAYGQSYFRIFARLRPGQTPAQAAAAALPAERALAQRMPDRESPLKAYTVLVRPFVDEFLGDYRSLLLILLGAVSFVLLIACTNVANLLLARGASRARELAIRAALGAGRARLVRQLLTESLVLALAGSLLGLALASALLKLIVAVIPASVPRVGASNIDWRVLGFTLILGVASTVIFGLLPAVRAAGDHLETVLREGGRTGRSGRDRLRGFLVTAEVALAITLLVGSGLLIRSAWLARRVNLGFEPRGVLTARLVLPAARYPDGASIVRLFEHVREDAARINGIRSTALTLLPPMSGSNFNSSIEVEGAANKEDTRVAKLRLTSDGYFATMGIPLLAGRDLSPHDDASSPLVVVINRSLADKLWPGRDWHDALGKRVNAMAENRKSPHLMTVVGVVGDLHDEGPAKPVKPEFYAPVAQAPEFLWPIAQRSLAIVLKAANRDAEPDSFVRPLRTVIASIDPSLPIADARSMDSFQRGLRETTRMNTILLATLGGIALALAMVGIYGVVSYFVSQRTQEIGIRIALGASPGRVWQFVVRRGLTPIVLGVIVGFALSLVTTSVLREQLYQVSPHDPFTLTAVAAVLLSVAVLAMYLPARRAMRVAPILALSEG